MFFFQADWNKHMPLSALSEQHEKRMHKVLLEVFCVGAFAFTSALSHQGFLSGGLSYEMVKSPWVANNRCTYEPFCSVITAVHVSFLYFSCSKLTARTEHLGSSAWRGMIRTNWLCWEPQTMPVCCLQQLNPCVQRWWDGCMETLVVSEDTEW